MSADETVLCFVPINSAESDENGGQQEKTRTAASDAVRRYYAETKTFAAKKKLFKSFVAALRQCFTNAS